MRQLYMCPDSTKMLQRDVGGNGTALAEGVGVLRWGLYSIDEGYHGVSKGEGNAYLKASSRGFQRMGSTEV